MTKEERLLDGLDRHLLSKIEAIFNEHTKYGINEVDDVVIAVCKARLDDLFMGLFKDEKIPFIPKFSVEKKDPKTIRFIFDADDLLDTVLDEDKLAKEPIIN